MKLRLPTFIAFSLSALLWQCGKNNEDDLIPYPVSGNLDHTELNTWRYFVLTTSGAMNEIPVQGSLGARSQEADAVFINAHDQFIFPRIELVSDVLTRIWLDSLLFQYYDTTYTSVTAGHIVTVQYGPDPMYWLSVKYHPETSNLSVCASAFFYNFKNSSGTPIFSPPELQTCLYDQSIEAWLQDFKTQHSNIQPGDTIGVSFIGLVYK